MWQIHCILKCFLKPFTRLIIKLWIIFSPVYRRKRGTYFFHLDLIQYDNISMWSITLADTWVHLNNLQTIALHELNETLPEWEFDFYFRTSDACSLHWQTASSNERSDINRLCCYKNANTHNAGWVQIQRRHTFFFSVQIREKAKKRGSTGTCYPLLWVYLGKEMIRATAFRLK